MAIELKDIILKDQAPVYNDIVKNGPSLTPQQIIATFSDKQWEEFTEECAFALKEIYKDVKKFGSSGDQGIDIAGFKTDDFFKGPWDLYQCKHYSDSVGTSDILLELGKLCYYTFQEEYTVPQNYYIVAPKGVSTSLAKLVRGKHEDLRTILIDKWPSACESKITSTEKIKLTDRFQAYVSKFDFSIVKDISVLKILELHRKTPYYHTRFPGGLPLRPKPDTPPDEISSLEAVYIQKLLNAYAQYLEKATIDISDLKEKPILHEHLKKCRIHFYCAESLHKFSRDHLPPGEFERLQDSFFEGIENIVLKEHKNGFERVKEVVQEAYKIQIDSHPLKERMELVDRAGICHQLANNNRITWVK